MNTTIQLVVIDGRPTTTSLEVARNFGKRHDDVLKAIRNLLMELPSEPARNFAETSIEADQPNGGTRSTPAYRLTRDGFTLLAMGFTGKKALQFKLAYITEFNRMEAALNSSSAVSEANWNASQLAKVAQEQVVMMKRFVSLVESQNDVLQGLAGAIGAMQITLSNSVRSHSRQIAKAFRLAEHRSPNPVLIAPLDPDRPLSKSEREKALHMFRSGVPFKSMSKRLNRSHRVLEQWATTEPEVIRSIVGNGLF